MSHTHKETLNTCDNHVHQHNEHNKDHNNCGCDVHDAHHTHDEHHENCCCHEHAHEHHHENHCDCHAHKHHHEDHEHHENHCDCHDHEHHHEDYEHHHENHCDCHDHNHEHEQHDHDHHKDSCGCGEHHHSFLDLECGCGCGHDHGHKKSHGSKNSGKDGSEDGHDHGHDHGHENERLESILLIAGAAIFVVGLVLTNVHTLLGLALFVIAYALLGWEVLINAVKGVIKGHMLDENFLMAIATIGAFAIGEFPEAVGVMLFYRTGEWFEHKAVAKSRSQIMEVLDLRPETVTLIKEDGTATVPAAQAKVGDLVLVRPGDRIPLDGTVIEGESRIDTSPITGEPVPVGVQPGSAVISGCVNTQGVLHIKVDKPLSESMVTRILDSVEKASANKPKIDRFITRFARVYTPFVVIAALCTAIIPSLITGEWSKWIYTALTFLVISCPCALVLSVPLAFFSGIGAGSKKGILFKGGVALEALKKVKTVVLDKTGTITKGNFVLQNVVSLSDEYSKEQILSLAAACEANSSHPIAQSICEANSEQKNSLAADHAPVVSAITEISGHGIKATISESTLLCGNMKLMSLHQVDTSAYKPASYGTEVLLAKDNLLIGYLQIADTIKEEATESIHALKKMGLTTVMLTGDAEETAHGVAAETGIDHVYAKLLPEEKLSKMSEIRTTYGETLFVGDGINDAPVLAGADVGAAMGSGADAAIEAADVIFMNSNLSCIPSAIGIANMAGRIAMQNVVLALITKAIIMVLGLCGFASMWLAVFGDTGVAMLCILNSVRILYKK